MIKHVSLDAWNTILIPNPEYAEYRTHILSRTFNCSFEFAKNVYTLVKRKFDTFAEKRGEAFNQSFIYDELINAFPKSFNPEVVSADLLRMELEQVFNTFPPTILEETIDTVNTLKEQGITFNVASNTNFISGSILANVINKARINFDFMVFSDLMHACQDTSYIMPSKPNPNFFKKVEEYANILHPNGISREEIIHIGDSDICDFQGATKFGLQARLLKSVDELPALLMEIR